MDDSRPAALPSAAASGPDDQTPTLAWLSAVLARAGGAPVERIETHASIVLLAGDRAYKLKRAVRYDYLDFSTPARRRRACEDELRLNRRLAPQLYLGVSAITRDDAGRLAFDGPGEPVDWVVVMRRFSQDALLDRLAAAGSLDPALMPRLGDAVARLHLAAAPRRDHGGADGMRWVVDGNARAFAEEAAGSLDAGACAALTAAHHAALDRHGAHLDRRRAGGSVRECHGDLHLRNVVLLDGEPTLFDGIEFNDELSCVDVLYDLAFLLMDLLSRGLPVHANLVFSHYLARTGDLDGLPLVPFFLSCRAAIRAKTSATAAALQADPERRGELGDRARAYLRMASRLLDPAPPALVAIGGPSGVGKSTLAARLAPAIGPPPGALVLRSDVLRKHRFGAAYDAPLPPAAYTSAAGEAVYEDLIRRAAAALAAGWAVVIDAVAIQPAQRAAMAALARTAGVPFAGLWLDAPADVLAARLGARRGDASDATAAVMRRQLRAGPGALDWTRVDATGTPDEVEAAARRHLAHTLGGAVGRTDGS